MFGFNTAFSYLMQGKKVRQAKWPIDGFIEVDEGGDWILDEDGRDFFDVSDSSSLLADDWERVD